MDSGLLNFKSEAKIGGTHAPPESTETEERGVILVHIINLALVRNLIFQPHTPVTGVYQ
jgi:hypothetical protein